MHTTHSTKHILQVTVTLEKQSEVDMKIWSWKLVGFRGGSVAKNPPAKAEDQGPIPGPGRSHMLGSSSARASQLLKPQRPRVRAPQREKPPQWETPAPQLESGPLSPQPEKSQSGSENPAQPKLNNK